MTGQQETKTGATSHAPLSVFLGGGFAILASLPCPGFVYRQNTTSIRHFRQSTKPLKTKRRWFCGKPG